MREAKGVAYATAITSRFASSPHPSIVRRARGSNPQPLSGHHISSDNGRPYRMRIHCGYPVFPDEYRPSHFASRLRTACGRVARQHFWQQQALNGESKTIDSKVSGDATAARTAKAGPTRENPFRPLHPPRPAQGGKGMESMKKPTLLFAGWCQSASGPTAQAATVGGRQPGQASCPYGRVSATNWSAAATDYRHALAAGVEAGPALCQSRLLAAVKLDGRLA